ncbi:hypothetical protein [Lutibaculum baratangense]|uniref:Uncharacterized protein n=1 Tax=Lutibaculum baratangense AMV1 TaxID=631454 RepID=V4TAV2_9HYPH|nr:hypothetical protein [Lutibaculum baratangense]ESR23558.1 hypothetical protein N177_3626 [Lutibaculum baratangense AMV1]
MSRGNMLVVLLVVALIALGFVFWWYMVSGDEASDAAPPAEAETSEPEGTTETPGTAEPGGTAEPVPAQ